MTPQPDDAFDARLGALLADPPPAPDPRFTARVLALVEADRRLAGARRAAWRRVAVEALAAAAVAAALLALAQLSGSGATLPAGPALAGMLALFAWLGVGQAPRFSV